MVLAYATKQCPGEDSCSERGACSFILPRPSSLWAEETFFLFVYNIFEDFSAAQPFLLQQVNDQPVHNFLSQQNTVFFTFSFSFWAYGYICGWTRPVSSRSAKQPGWRSPPIVTIALQCQVLPLLEQHQAGASPPTTMVHVAKAACCYSYSSSHSQSRKNPGTLVCHSLIKIK